ncbi:beta-1,3-galactosyltransferase 1-like [Babylonia areolata]|uniref:beta-1,3-galactosyltransferase 1-like n=1 Tax=Babylonia areolata TaxID=304850 RepID=UPI003FD0EB6F
MVIRLLKYRHAACLFLCLLAAPPLVSWIAALWSPDNVVLDLSGMSIPAVYRRAVRHEDGTIDLTINIPASVDVLKRLLDRQEQLKYNLTVRARTDVPKKDKLQKKKDEEKKEDEDVPKTYYPVTLNAPYMLNSADVCKGVDPLHVLVVVHTATHNFQRRRLIRETWAGQKVMTTRTLRLVFLLGLTTDASAQRQIENERLVYGDLVQGRFKDSYHNLTHKGVMAYRWIYQYCPQAQLILKVDDDVFINPFLFYHVYYPRFQPRNRTIACHLRPINTSPIQRNKGKWKVQDYEFRGYKHYPVRYCNGYVVIITPDIIRAMYFAAYTTPFFWVDDVYLYGLLPAKVGNVTFEGIQKNMTLISKTGFNCYKKPNCSILATVVPKEVTLNEMWQLTLQQIPPDIKPQVNPVYLVT